MDRRLAQAIEVITTAACAWFAFRLLGYFFSVLVIVVFFLAVANAVAVWMLRFDKQRVSSICSNRYIKYYITWICRITNTQPPISNTGGAPGDLLLHFDDDYRTAAWRAKQVVMGHDRVIDNLLWRVRDAALLRKRQPANATSPPLATFLLVGGEGIGKRFLSLVLAKLLYRSGAAITFNCHSLSPQSLFGAHGNPGELLEAVRNQPSQLIIFERIDEAPPELQRELRSIVTTGYYKLRYPESDVSFQNTTLVFTTTKGLTQLESVCQHSTSEITWHKKAVEALASETHLDSEFLNSLGEIVLCNQPSDEDKARVTDLLMTRECKRHGIALTQIDERIIAAEVLRMDEEKGFSQLPQDIKRLLTKPILAALKHNRQKLSLQVRTSRYQTSGTE